MDAWSREFIIFIKDSKIISIKKLSKIITTIETLLDKGLTEQEKKEVRCYDINNKIIFNKDIKINLEQEIIILEKNKDFEIKNINNKDNTITIECGGEQITIDPSKYASKLNLYETEQKEIAPNYNIKFMLNDKDKGIVKGGKAVVKDYNKDSNTITLISEKKQREITIDLNNNKDKHLSKIIEYGNVSTVHSAQGMTSKNLIAVLDDTTTTIMKNFYVVSTRPKENTTLIVSNSERIRDRLLGNSGEKKQAIDLE